MRTRLLLLAAIAIAALPAPARAAAPVVSLTFDDAVDVAAPVTATLPPLRATFYLNSDNIGVSGGLSLGAIQQLAAAGDEIGGHTANHLDLARIEDPVELRREACWDRKQLSILPRGDGSGGTLDIMSFAYPNGDYAWPDDSGDPHVIDLISGTAAPGPAFGGCAYSSARAVGGVLPTKPCLSATVDTACVLKGLPALPFADPQQRFRIPTPSSIDGANGSARFATLRNWVSAAERAGAAGGASSPWLVLVLHDVCDPPADPAAPCPGRHAIRADDLATLATYLKAEQAAGRLAVRTVTGALDSAYGTVTRERPLGLDAVPTPTAQARVVNGAMDADTPIGLATTGDGRPDCFDVSNEQAPVTRARLRQADGTVGWVARLDVPRGESQRFTVRHDLGGCAVGVTAGRRYRLSVSY
ncbi:MAG TPA: polysaccharide deacetylase family protein, partial [Baekduia sp.]|nr:polysaccharide deacetylase family protein [Baekduia sp.]